MISILYKGIWNKVQSKKLWRPNQWEGSLLKIVSKDDPIWRLLGTLYDSLMGHLTKQVHFVWAWTIFYLYPDPTLENSNNSTNWPDVSNMWEWSKIFTTTIFLAHRPGTWLGLIVSCANDKKQSTKYCMITYDDPTLPFLVSRYHPVFTKNVTIFCWCNIKLYS
jgi:hypothetical protein